MKKAAKLLSVLALAFISLNSFTTSEPVTDCGCPPGWVLFNFDKPVPVPGLLDNPNLIKDVNGDKKLCYKNLPGKKANGNNLGTRDARNWKDNNEPCD